MPPSLHRRTLLLAGAAALAAPAWAQSDNKPVHFILPNATGSAVDAITRAAQPALAKALGHPVVVDNQPGAGGIVGLQALARSAPDGLTLGVVSNNVVIFPSLYKSLPFDMPGDFTPIAVVGSTPMLLLVHPKVPATNAKELIALLKARPGELNFGSGGNGTILHLAMETFLDDTGTKARHIPYKGVGPMVTDLIAGQVELGAASLPSVQGHIKSGALRAIGLFTPQRVAAAPDVLTFVEQGLPKVVVEAWFAVVGPKGLGATQVQRVRDAVAAAFADPATQEAMARQGNQISVGTPEQALPFFRNELAKKIGLEAQ